MIDPTWQYKIWTGHQANGEQLLQDATITKRLNDQWLITVGQFKTPIWREFLISETATQFVERSLLTSATLSGKYTQGVIVEHRVGDLRLFGSINDGKTDANHPWASSGTDFGVTGRAEYLVFGDAKRVNVLDALGGGEPALLLGAALHYEEGEHGDSQAEYEDVTWSADATLALGNSNLFAGVIGSHTDDPSLGDRIGFLIQGGVFVTEKLEFMARYEHAVSDADGVDDLSIVTVGAAYFLAGWNARLVGDVGYAFNAVDTLWAASSAGYLTDVDDDDGQTVLRMQMQLLF